MNKYVVLNKYGRLIGVANSILDIANGLGMPSTTVYNAYNTGKPLVVKKRATEYLILSRSKHEYLWHKHGGKKGGDDYFAFCTPEELTWYKNNEKKAVTKLYDYD